MLIFTLKFSSSLLLRTEVTRPSEAILAALERMRGPGNLSEPTHNAECGLHRSVRKRTSSTEFSLIGFLGSLPLWSFQNFASGKIATPHSTGLNVTFAGA
jgi:hypothetical protein